MQELRVGSLFSGIGGIELGLERAGGFETAWFVEQDKHAQVILSSHWPRAAIYDDVTTLDRGSVPRVDVLIPSDRWCIIGLRQKISTDAAAANKGYAHFFGPGKIDELCPTRKGVPCRCVKMAPD